MTIIGKDNAIAMGTERANRSKQSICVVQIDNDEFILWREVTRMNIGLIYKYYKIVKVIEYASR